MNAIPASIASISSAAVLFANSPAIPLVQVTLLLSASLCFWRLLYRQRAAIRHLLLASQLVVAPVLVLTAAFNTKPDITFWVEGPTPRDQPSSSDLPTGSAPTHDFQFVASNDVSYTTSRPDESDATCMTVDSATSPPVLNESASGGHSSDQGGGSVEATTNAVRAAGISWPIALAAVWAMGLVLLILRLVSGVRRLRRDLAVSRVVDPGELPDESQELLAPAGIELRESSTLSMPLASGFRRPFILLPSDFRDWSDLRLRSVLAHETAHIQRFDPAVGFASYVCCSVLWFHPLMWLLHSLMRREGEKAADDVALRSGIRPADYAEQLVSLVREYGRQIQPRPGVVSMASQSDLRRRVHSVLNRTDVAKRRPYVGAILIVMAVVVPIIAGSVRVDRAHAAEPSRDGTQQPTTEANSPADRLAELRRREADALNATKELRQLIDDELNSAWQRNAGKHHTMTVVFLTKALAQLGQFEVIEELRNNVRATGDEALARVVNNYSDGVFTGHLLRRDYIAADKAKSRSSKESTYYGQISWAIRNRDLDVAEKMMADLAKIRREKDGKVRYGRALMLSNAQLAPVAHWLGETERVIPALRRYRAFAENKPVSDRPFTQETEWITTNTMFGPTFVLALASSGHGDVAEEVIEALELGNPDNLKSFFPYSHINFCSRLAIAGDGERALRFARRKFDGIVPAELYRTLCRRAVFDGDMEAAARFAGEFEKAAAKLSIVYATPRAHKKFPLTDQVLVLDRVSKSISLVSRFVKDMKTDRQPQLAGSAAALYMKLSDRFVDEFENKSQASDIQSLRALDGRVLKRFDIEPLVGVLASEELRPFAERQQDFFGRCLPSLQVRSFPMKPSKRFAMTLAHLGVVPADLSRFETREQLRILERLLAAGNLAGAKTVFESAQERALRIDRTGVVSGSFGGRVVNSATQLKYAAARMAALCGELDAGVEIVDRIQHHGERVDGYRVLAKAFAENSDLADALSWAKSQSGPDVKLAAFVGILESEAAAVVVTEPDEVATFIEEVRRFGEPFVFWGC